MSAHAKTGWSVMGTGTIATEHMVGAIRAIGHDPLWIISSRKRDAADFAEDLDVPHHTTDLLRVLQDPEVRYSYVSARLSRRPHYISAAANARKHILCDGPIARTSRIAAALVESCRQTGISLAVNQPFRASTIHQIMQRLIAEGEVGQVRSIVMVRGGPYHSPPHRRAQDPDDSNSIYIGLSVDDIDLARFLTGAEPVEANALSVVSGNDPTHLAYSIRLDNGAIFQAHESYRTTDLESLVLVAGERGALMASGTLDSRCTGTLVRNVGGRAERVPLRERDPHVATVSRFVGSPRQSSSWLATGQDSVAALRAAEAVAMSVRSRRSTAVVDDRD